LRSRCQLYTLNPLGEKDLQNIIDNALKKDIVLQEKKIKITETKSLFRYSGGDARRLLNLFELCVGSTDEMKATVDNETVMRIAQQNTALYDKSGEQHYDIISAFIKSIRGSDPNAAVYWLARMLAGGEDVKFIARRMVILASEDIGNANPTALVMAQNCFQAVHTVGMPEARIILSQCATYLASAPKSNSAYIAIKKAEQMVAESGDLSVPLSLRNAPTKLMKELGYGDSYAYAHDYEENFIEQEYLPETIKGTQIYDPAENPRENELRAYLKSKWKGKYNY
jgi:putative ATPase